ncbi:PLC-like phosphodiesterase [Podospora appendiculata]|uniref:PLC-like phosphodiesterase n=1 Tax=Podospora appendiculata TaxID=314037 RepID=A0AAE0XF83_9PEZI|nr:PLC-like phosphodiesterase [Podospora appendiculata]
MVLSSLFSSAAVLLSLSPVTYAIPQAQASSTTTQQRTSTVSLSSSATAPGSPIPCNNSPKLCSRAYNNITHMGAHDSSFLRDASTSNSIAGDQYYNATVALSAGIRLLQTQVHDYLGGLELCHTSCALLDAGSLEAWLAKIKYWLDHNANEVVTLLLVNSDNKNASDFGLAFESSGLDTYGYVPTSNSSTKDWPTLQSMITSNKRLVTFIASITPSPSYPYLLNEFTYVFETPYDVKSLSNFTCNLDRPSSQSSAASALKAQMLPLLNHFAYTSITSDIEVPNVSDIDTTNSPETNVTGALGQHADNCTTLWDTKPVFMLVDFYDHGPAVDTADRLNGITAVGRITSSSSAGAEGSGVGTVRDRGAMAVALLAFIVGVVVVV